MGHLVGEVDNGRGCAGGNRGCMGTLCTVQCFFVKLKPYKSKVCQLKKRESQDKENIGNKDIIKDGTATSVAL